MTTEKLVWIDSRHGAKGRGIVILPIIIFGSPFLIAVFGYGLLSEPWTGAEPVFWLLVFCLIFSVLSFIGVTKYAILLRIAPQRVLHDHNVFKFYFYFGAKKSVHVREILCAHFVIHGTFVSIFSPSGSRLPTLILELKDGSVLWLNGDYAIDSELVSLLSAAGILDHSSINSTIG